MDDKDRDLPHNEHSSSEMTIQWCIRKCKEDGYRYAGLQRGDTCYCGHSFGKHGLAVQETCKITCSGDNTQTCGSHWRIEIYMIG